MQAKPSYKIISHFRGDPGDSLGPKCQFRRYAVEIWLDGGSASSGSFAVRHGAGMLYYLGNLPQDGIRTDINFDISRKRGGAEVFLTEKVEFSWSSDSTVDARAEKKKIATLLFCFCSWGMEYSEIESRDPHELIAPFGTAIADGEEIAISENEYMGVVNPEYNPPIVPECPADREKGERLSRFVLMSDAHIGPTYHGEEYGWLNKLDRQLKSIHAEYPIDFVAQLGDNIDDGYEKNYERDYGIYLEQIKKLTLLDPENPLEGRAADKVPHYEMQGNHDTSLKTRFFRNKLWFTEGEGGKAAYIAFFTGYGGYPLVNHDVSGSYTSYRSYGVISKETVAFVEESLREAAEQGAKQIILFSHFGISQELNAPVLPESGLGSLYALCEKYGVTLFFNGHEHNSDFTHRMYKNIHDFDLATAYFKYAVVDLYEKVCEITVYDTEKESVYRIDRVAIGE